MIRYFTFLALILLGFTPNAQAQQSLAKVISTVQPRMVKLYGAGGVQGLEAYQSAFLISNEGHILTAWSYVLDADVITATLDDGRKLTAEMVGMDPRLEIAVLKVDAQDLPHFNLDEAITLEAGQRVLAFSNLYGVATGNEPTSVLRGIVSAKADLAARRGAFETNYRGKVYVVDAMTNNPGAAGGALTDSKGRLAGLIGKELRNSQTNTWLNFAIPIGELAQAVVDIRAGKLRAASRNETAKKPKESHTLAQFGIRLVPDFLPKTPPFVESVKPMSPAAKADIRTDDLILFVNEHLVPSHKQVVEELTFVDRVDPVRLTIQRGQELLEVQLTLEP
ncbi:S1C family serine protease [Anatilimnocola floriformis]|uniref:S1C family serine protease n=1 Tax=Anatilimnocola floriformis TaxID=2948575 RepID=UPI0020C3E821|nr:S1C family serine protease [Anatilimnocola floriformis]